VLKRNRQTIDDTLQESSKRLRKSVSNVASSAVDAGFGVGKQGVEQIRRGMTMVGPGIKTVRLYVGSELARRRSRGAPGGPNGAPVEEEEAEQEAEQRAFEPSVAEE